MRGTDRGREYPDRGIAPAPSAAPMPLVDGAGVNVATLAAQVRPAPPASIEEPNPAPPPAPAPRPFGRVLDPVDPWLEPADDATRTQLFRGRYDTISVASLTGCPPAMVLAGFYGPASYQMPVVPAYFAFADVEAEEAGATLEPEPSEPPWPPEYSSAHHNLTGDQVAVAGAMVAHHNRGPHRVVPVARLDVLHEIAALLGRADVHPTYKKAGWKRIRGLLKLAVEREESWVPVALAHGHVLDDDLTQGEFRKLYNGNRPEWNRVAERVPRVDTVPAFGRPAKKG